MTGNDDDLASQQFCVRWNCHMGSLGAAFHQLLAGQRFVDVTLACDGHQIHCHRLVLAACSTYFESILGENPCKHPIIILPREVRLWQVQALVDFMYRGEVNVSQSGLQDLLKCAEALQIRGLCGSEAAVNLSNIANLTTMGIASGEMITAQNHSIIANPTVTSSSTITVPIPIPISQQQPQSSKSLVRRTVDILSSGASTNHLGSAATIPNAPSIVVPPNNLDLDDGNSGGSRPSLEITRIDDIDDSDLKMCEEYDDDNSNVKLESVDDRQSKDHGQIRVKSNENLFENYKTNSTNCQLLPKSLKFNRNTMSISVKSNKTIDVDDDDDDDCDDDTLIIDNDENYENIICSPNFIELSNNDEYEDDDEDDFVIEDEICFDEDSKLPALVPFQPNHHEYNDDQFKKTPTQSLKLKDKNNFEHCLLNGGPPPSQFVLRNPRGNQPRTYNSDALWAALMDVKSGESIYRASQMHKVPRKTLRNWMKRWDIKSAFPMPRQLRQAAEKRKANKKDGALVSDAATFTFKKE